MLALAWTRIVDANTSLNTTVYRNSASGSYDYFDGADKYRFNLDHHWYGVTSAVNRTSGALQLNAGLNANTYARAHRGYYEPSTTLYDNTGHKADVSAFLKAGYTMGRARWFADLQGRHARFRYEPDANAGIDRTFDRLDLLQSQGRGDACSSRRACRRFASYGATTREPARSDLFAGDDDLNASNVGGLRRLHPREARVGARPRGGDQRSRAPTWDLSANVYSMDFHNDIARIGAPTASGAVLRRNVGSSYRRGLELDGSWRAIPRLTLSGNATLSTNRIRAFTDSSRGTPVVRRNVEPLLTPRVITTQRADVRLTPVVSLSAEGRYQSRAFLDNTGSADRVLPSLLHARRRRAPDAGALRAHGARREPGRQPASSGAGRSRDRGRCATSSCRRAASSPPPRCTGSRRGRRAKHRRGDAPGHRGRCAVRRKDAAPLGAE